MRTLRDRVQKTRELMGKKLHKNVSLHYYLVIYNGKHLENLYSLKILRKFCDEFAILRLGVRQTMAICWARFEKVNGEVSGCGI